MAPSSSGHFDSRNHPGQCHFDIRSIDGLGDHVAPGDLADLDDLGDLGGLDDPGDPCIYR